MKIRTLISSLLALTLVACGGDDASPTNTTGTQSTAPIPTAIPTPVPTPVPTPTPTNTANQWPVSSYKVHQFGNKELTSTVNSSTLSSGLLSLGNTQITLNGTVALDNLTISNWRGSWKHKVDFRAIMLCDEQKKAKYVLLENSSPALSFGDIKGQAFEYIEDCGNASSNIKIDANGSIIFTKISTGGTQIISQNDAAAAFSASGLNTGTETIYLKAYKVFYPDGNFWNFVVEHSVSNSNLANSYMAWWKQTSK
ncbi:hypothetical protein [Iodobacter fluviatilis]|uniref:Uncharacterized protein n=1 Tax=Iodobacter fluviatilis TaxID=537 RepID=A0A377SVA4_9NEIS|nr:hypothetical protein [Iodobacter fluviatilis]TCU85058.1 hypothetical protein EV682_10882 [Iodobacter fluviatilis]STR45258.1 Uncharacterised protein [Iodobacter fluviatilis]